MMYYIMQLVLSFANFMDRFKNKAKGDYGQMHFSTGDWVLRSHINQNFELNKLVVFILRSGDFLIVFAFLSIPRETVHCYIKSLRITEEIKHERTLLKNPRSLK